MLRTGSFKAAARLPGEKYSIARSQPRGCRYKVVPWLLPTWEMIQGYKQGRLTWADYTRQYLALLEGPCGCPRKAQGHTVKDHLRALKALVEQGREIVLLCWEEKGQPCHRILVARYLIDHLGLDPGLVVIE